VLDRQAPFRSMLEGNDVDVLDEDILPVEPLAMRLDRVSLAGTTPGRASPAGALRWQGRPRASAPNVSMIPLRADAPVLARVVKVMAMPPPPPMSMEGASVGPVVATNTFELRALPDEDDLPARPLPTPPLTRFDIAGSDDTTHIARDVLWRSFSAAETQPLDEDIPTDEGNVVVEWQQAGGQVVAAVAMPALSEEGLSVFGVDDFRAGDLSALATALDIGAANDDMPLIAEDEVVEVTSPDRDQADVMLGLSVQASALPITDDAATAALASPTAAARAHHLYLLAVEKLAVHDVRGALAHLELACGYDPDNSLFKDLHTQTKRRVR
jgi:hypothetical protein